ncbi:MAG: type II toxin-antitoxin system Phd/YefM family antitoxin [Opitutales bacterium]
MKTATLRDLRNNFAKLESWLAEGQQVKILKRGEPVAVLRRPSKMKQERGELARPNFKERRQALWGDQVFSAKEVAAMREAELEGEEG